ncbi:MAG: ribonuclease domain-containing protein [Campylobacter sp.]
MKIDKRWIWLLVFFVALGWNFLNFNQNSATLKEVKLGQAYTSKDEVASYIYKFSQLPPNFITKKQARSLGWDPQNNYLSDVAPQKSIGGDRFGNKERTLPDKDGRKWFECDIDYQSGKRNAKRIVFSNDGMIYYTPDHYKNFYLLFERKQL